MSKRIVLISAESKLQSLLLRSSKNVTRRKSIFMACASMYQYLWLPKRLLIAVPSPNALVENMFLLVLTAGIKIGLTAWTFGMMVRFRI